MMGIHRSIRACRLLRFECIMVVFECKIITEKAMSDMFGD